MSAPPEERLRAAAERPDEEGRIVLDAEGTPVGFWSLTVHDGGWLVELVRIVTLAPRRGIGSWALARMVARAFDDLGAHRVYLEVTADNTAARTLYERAGFVLEGTWRDGFRDAASGGFKDLCAYGMLARDRG